MRINILFGFISLILISSCKKTPTEDEQTCTNIQNATIISNSPVTVGGTVTFSTQEVGGYRIYSWHGPHNYENQYPDNSITGAQFENEGWYYLDLYSLGSTGCQKIDSVYIDMLLEQGTAPCSVTNNTAEYNNLPNDSYINVSKIIDPNFSQKTLEADGFGAGFPNMKVYFHTHWRDFEPEDGIYYTTNTPVFDQVDYNYNKVFITTTKSSIYWASHEGQLVYVSHVGSKLQVKFCNLNMSGSNGMSFTTVVNGNILEL